MTEKRVATIEQRAANAHTFVQLSVVAEDIPDLTAFVRELVAALEGRPQYHGVNCSRGFFDGNNVCTCGLDELEAKLRRYRGEVEG